jgi:hypothetical protein
MSPHARACLTLGLWLAACSPQERLIPDAPDGALPEGDTVTLVAAGDIAACSGDVADRTAALIDRIPGAVMTLGDNVYPNATIGDFLNCFEPTWGRHRGRMRPTIGNHEYHTPHAGAYFAYFGQAAGTPFEGRYSFDLGRWHVVSLNSNCVDGQRLGDIDVALTSRDFGGCGDDSAQAEWLRADLAAHPSACTLAAWHHPRFSSGFEGDYPGMAALWTILQEHRVEIMLNGHDHDYERFAPQLADGTRDDANGIREFVVGTGGIGLHSLGDIEPNSEAGQDITHGVLKLTLRPNDYDWEFVSVKGEPAFTDKGHGTCR